MTKRRHPRRPPGRRDRPDGVKLEDPPMSGVSDFDYVPPLPPVIEAARQTLKAFWDADRRA